MTVVDEPAAAGSVEPPKKKSKSSKSTKACVAKLTKMDGKVTGRSVAYAAVMVRMIPPLCRQILTFSTSWSSTLHRPPSGVKNTTGLVSRRFIPSWSITLRRSAVPRQRPGSRHCLAGGLSTSSCSTISLHTNLFLDRQVFPGHISAVENGDASRNLLLAQDGDY